MQHIMKRERRMHTKFLVTDTVAVIGPFLANELVEKLAEKEGILNSFLEKQSEIVEEKYDRINATPIEAESINTDKNKSESMEIDKSKLLEKLFELEKKLLEAEKAAAGAYDNNQLKMLALLINRAIF
ncbi:hypothetical protein WUBG_16471 [Wuchereria bancrofti]|uniref:Uncharacterized protein n=1 Tax=Wuchereria bancrofti TaxID=6293 RepID=J9AF06_WUCBA|nr:hypothetical protein WUBG_16471 [Wuchereria bancrofti]